MFAYALGKALFSPIRWRTIPPAWVPWPIQASSGLIYTVFREYDPENPLLEQAEREGLENQMDLKRLRAALGQMADWTLQHDRRSGGSPPSLRIDRKTGRIGESPFILHHHPEPDAEGYVLAGHLHPAVRLQGTGNWRETLPCFWFGDRIGVLPVFGRFTGTSAVRPERSDRMYVIAGTEVIGPFPR